ncbi:hypothetical protein ATN84_03365 [Paramesorhizobium deserti]|uniref:P-type conjugative transfer protein TrbG n=1 Tax=Paramesorhizobium deserti TaxID=1494590 RepID=A0A135I081_9HYPH|nr:hypothetical protein [Paramesorhizobium deserti]KXF78818.1 hypothetical protein ATN84_03365 [Paramesorhizobium deserti]
MIAPHSSPTATAMKLLSALILVAALSACASPRPVRPTALYPAVEPLPPEIKPLTREQEEQMAQ